VVLVMIWTLPRSAIAGARAAVVASTLGDAHAVILETTVRYFGPGIQPPTASWGNMLSNSQLNMWTAPWIATFPGRMILLT
jgi:peptide/nickel transport system permease protein